MTGERSYPETSGLQPCPFCGSIPKCGTSRHDEENPPVFCFECPNGCSVSKDSPTYDGAVEIWNTRHPALAQAARQSSADCDHLWMGDGGRGSGGAAVITCEKCGVTRKASDSPAWSKACRLHYGPLDHFGPEDNDPGTAFIIHNVDDTVIIKVRSPGDRVFSEIEMPLDAWIKLRSVGGPDTSPVPSTPRATPERTMVVGRVTGKLHEGDQVAGMLGAICHACGLKDYPCVNPDCPNRASQVTSTNGNTP